MSGFVERKKKKNHIAVDIQKILLSVISADVISSDLCKVICVFCTLRDFRSAVNPGGMADYYLLRSLAEVT